MAVRRDSEEYRLLLKLEEQVRQLRQALLAGEDEARKEAMQVLCQLGYSTKQAEVAVEGTPAGLDAAGIVREVFSRRK